MKRCAVCPGQFGNGGVSRAEGGDDQLLGDQAPSRVADYGEVEAAVRQWDVDCQPDDLGEVPQVVIEQRAANTVGQG